MGGFSFLPGLGEFRLHKEALHGQGFFINAESDAHQLGKVRDGEVEVFVEHAVDPSLVAFEIMLAERAAGDHDIGAPFDGLFQECTVQPESGFLDGAGDFSSFVLITLPLALPSIAVAGLIAFLMAYSEFALGWLFVDKAQNVTLAMSVYAMVQTGNAQPWSYLGSLAIIMSIPVVVVFLLLQRTLLDRMMFGEMS